MRSRISAVIAALVLGTVPAQAKDKPAKPAVVADPPAVLGDAYQVDGKTYVPADAPFDDVGLAGVLENAEAHVAVSHRTLPVPSYVEVTALDSGRTILARVEQRGPASGSNLVDLSPAAFAQLEAISGQAIPVRVRRVNPQEYERALLRTGQRAPERLPTPKPLLEVLRKRLAATPAPGPVAPSAAPIEAVLLPEAVVPPRTAAAKPTKTAKARKATPKPADASADAGASRAAPAEGSSPAAPRPSPRNGTYTVQVAAFANKGNAERTAARLGGEVQPAGNVWRVRLGPFASKSEATAAQDRARKSGFGDARITPAR